MKIQQILANYIFFSYSSFFPFFFDTYKQYKGKTQRNNSNKSGLSKIKGVLLIIINRACLSPAGHQQKIKREPRQPGS
jgi:hypothetical protein